MSIVGFVVALLLLIVVLTVVNSDNCDNSSYKYRGNCYDHKAYIGPYDVCLGVTGDDGYCYY